MDAYLWVRALHIIAMVAWMAGLLYLPRLYVYHAKAEVGSAMSEQFKIMEYRLLKYITTPAMIVTIILGLALVHYIGLNAGGWLHAKITLVLVLAGFHGALAKWRKDFANDANKHSEKFYRIANEVPTVLLIAIVILAVVKPF